MAVLFTLFLTSASLIWDASVSSNVIGYKIYQSSALAINTIDVGNVLEFPLTDLKPGLPYHYFATAYSIDSESVPSNSVDYIPPVQPTGLILLGNKLVANVFPGGVFQIDVSTNLKTWSLFRRFKADSDHYSVYIPHDGAGSYFRLFYNPLLKELETPPMPVEVAVKTRKLRIYKKIDERHGAQRLMKGEGNAFK